MSRLKFPGLIVWIAFVLCAPLSTTGWGWPGKPRPQRPVTQYRYRDDAHVCLSAEGAVGLNAGVLGECGELGREARLSPATSMSLNGSHWVGLNQANVELDDDSCMDCRWDDVVLSNLTISGGVTATHLDRLTVQSSDLSGGSIERVILDSADFSFTDLTRVQAMGTSLRKATFMDSKLDYASFGPRGDTVSDLGGARLERDTLTETSFVRAQLSDALIRDSKLRATYFAGASAPRLQIERSELTDVSFNRSEMSQARLSGVRANRLDLRGAVLDLARVENGALEQVDFSDAELNHTVFSDTTIRGATLQNSAGLGTNFVRSNAEQVRIDSSYFHQVSLEASRWSGIFWRTPANPMSQPTADGSFFNQMEFSDMTIQESSLKRASIRDSHFVHAVLDRVDLRDSHLQGVRFENSQSRAVQWDGASFVGCDLSGLDVDAQSSFIGATYDAQTKLPFDSAEAKRRGMISQTALGGTLLSRAIASMGVAPDATDLSGPDMRGANLRGADFRGANLSRFLLDYADLTGAQLDGSVLDHASLKSAKLSYASLKGVSARQASFYAATLDQADLTDAVLAGSALDGARAERATFVRTDLSHCTFSKALIQYSRLFRADLSASDLSDADLGLSDLEEAILSTAVANDRTRLPFSKTEATQRGVRYQDVETGK